MSNLTGPVVRGAAARVRSAGTDLRARHRWIDHLARTGIRYHERHGNHLAAAITFFSILNAVPLTMIAFAAAAYVLSFNPTLLSAIETRLAQEVPPELSDVVRPVMDAAIEQRNTVAGVGLVAALWAGVWWMSNLRQAVSAQWAIPPRNPASPRRLLSDLFALIGLWTALIGSLAITAVGTGLVDAVLGLAGRPGSGWTAFTRSGLGLLLGLLADWLIFLWVITRLPRRRQPVRGAGRAALLGAVGFETLRQGLTIYLVRVSGSPSGAVFGSLLGLLVFAYLVSRFVLLVTAWAATAPGNERSDEGASPAPAVAGTAAAPSAKPGKSLAPWMLGALALGLLLGTRLRWSCHRKRRSRTERDEQSNLVRRGTPAGRRPITRGT